MRQNGETFILQKGEESLRHRMRHRVQRVLSWGIFSCIWFGLAGAMAHAASLPTELKIYVNRYGGTYAKGYSDSVLNRSSLLGPGLPTALLRGFQGEEEAWARFLSCLQEQFEPYRIEWSQQEPSSGPYLELVVGDNPETLGLHGKTVGIAPMDKEGRRILPNAVVFVFSERIGAHRPQRMCEVAAQEIGHALGLDHSYLCEDPMSYLKGCGDKSFQDRAVPCGEHSPRTCKNGADTQNTVRLLAERLGVREGYELLAEGGSSLQLAVQREGGPTSVQMSAAHLEPPGAEAKTMSERAEQLP